MPYLSPLLYGFIYDIMVVCHFLSCCVSQISHSNLFLLQVDVAQASIEEDFAGVQLEFETQLFVVDISVPSQVE